MKRDRVVVKGRQTFEVYGDGLSSYFLSIWDHSGEESQRIDVELNDLIESLGELEVGTLTLNREEIRP